MAGPQNFACGLDGSKLSWLAFDFATNLMDRRQAGDTVRPASRKKSASPRRSCPCLVPPGAAAVRRAAAARATAGWTARSRPPARLPPCCLPAGSARSCHTHATVGLSACVAQLSVLHVAAPAQKKNLVPVSTLAFATTTTIRFSKASSDIAREITGVAAPRA